MKPGHHIILPAVLTALALPASAQIPVTITGTTDLTIWTDSFAGGGFDTIISLWSGGTRLTYYDDSQPVEPAQGFLDSVLRLQGLAPGSYLLTVSSYNNSSRTANFSDGIVHDASTPVPIGEWWLRGNGNYAVHLGSRISAFCDVDPGAWHLGDAAGRPRCRRQLGAPAASS